MKNQSFNNLLLQESVLRKGVIKKKYSEKFDRLMKEINIT